MEIHAAGGGIHYTVNQTKEASEDDLYKALIVRLDQMISHGTLSIEAKSGYGLDLDTEIKMLKVIKRAQDQHKINIQSYDINIIILICISIILYYKESTYLCAHAVPIGRSSDEMTEEIVEKHIDAVAKAWTDLIFSVHTVVLHNVQVTPYKVGFEYQEY